MRHLTLCSALVLSACAAGHLARERAPVVTELEGTRDALLGSVRGISAAQAQWKPSPDAWSIAEVAEHIAVTEEALYVRVSEKIVPVPPAPDLLARVRRDDAHVLR